MMMYLHGTNVVNWSERSLFLIFCHLLACFAAEKKRKCFKRNLHLCVWGGGE